MLFLNKKIEKQAVTQELRRFNENEKGNFAIFSALALAVLIGGLAVGVDIANAYAAKSRLQDTTDAIALMAAKDTAKTQAQLNTAAQDYFTITYPGQSGDRIKIKDVRRENDGVTVVAENNIDGYFTRIYGKENLDIAAQSSAVYSNKAMDVALVLDTTFSMNGSKLNNLKNASTNLVKTIEDQKNKNVRLSVVPFAQYVNVGLSRRNAVWLDVDADRTVKGAQVCRMKRDVTGRSNCRTIRKTCTNDGVNFDCSYKKCDKTYGPEYKSCHTPTKKYTWNGCVGSRKAPYNLDVAYSSRKIPGLVNVKCGTEIRPLTSNLSNVKKTIKSMSARGETYMPAGLAWGWRVLDERQPLTEASTTPKGIKKSEKVLVLMTDGENTKSKKGEFHTGNDAKESNATTSQLCNSIKNSDITVYTIAYDVTDKKTKSLLQGCATDNAKYFDAKNAKDLNAAFEEIGAALNELRITA
jgi:Flp pilus assembly protein TadG